MRFILEIFYDDFQKRKVALVYFYQKQSTPQNEYQGKKKVKQAWTVEITNEKIHKMRNLKFDGSVPIVRITQRNFHSPNT